MLVPIGPREMFLEDVRRARRMTPAERLLEGLRLLDRAVALAMDGLRHRFPGESEEHLLERLRHQFDAIERRERHHGR